MGLFIVWNEEKTEGFITADKQLAYEVRKCADSNCYDGNGNKCDVGIAFIEKWGEGNLTMEELK